MCFGHLLTVLVAVFYFVKVTPSITVMRRPEPGDIRTRTLTARRVLTIMVPLLALGVKSTKRRHVFVRTLRERCPRRDIHKPFYLVLLPERQRLTTIVLRAFLLTRRIKILLRHLPRSHYSIHRATHTEDHAGQGSCSTCTEHAQEQLPDEWAQSGLSEQQRYHCCSGCWLSACASVSPFL